MGLNSNDMRKLDNPVEVFSRRCPFCGANPGAWCMYRSGGIGTLIPHKERRERNPALRILQRLEWSAEEDDGTPHCPTCDAIPDEGHRDGCEFAFALSEVST